MQATDYFLKWMIDCAADGRGPPTAYRGVPWTSIDRISAVGKSRLEWNGFRVKFALLECRNDWDQYCYSWGMPKTNQARPCWYCPCLKQHLHDFPMVATPYTHDTYMALISASRIIVVIDTPDLYRVVASLEMDFREDGAHGRALNRDIDVFDVRLQAVVRLCKWSRLDLGGSVFDAHTRAAMLELEGGPPYTLHFWTKKPLLHNFSQLSPLMESAGMKFEHLMIGDLHTLDVGITGRIVGFVFVAVLKAGRKFKNKSSKAGMMTGCRSLSRALRQHQSRCAKFRKTRKMSRIGRITLKMLQWENQGSTGSLKAKGMETRECLLFAHRILQGSGVEHELELRAATRALLSAYGLMKHSERAIDADQLERLFETVSSKCKEAGVPMLPKHHLSRHFGHLSRRAGNPRFFSEYLDESKNRSVVGMAVASSNQSDFSSRLLAREILHTKFAAQLDF